MNVVVVICHDLGQELGCYGRSWIRSPRIDEFAASNLLFRRNFCPAPQCSPSRAAMWTGRFPHANGVVGLTHAGFANDLNSDEKHFAQYLAEAGYDTRLVHIQHAAQSWQRCGFQEHLGGGKAPECADAAVAFLESRRDNDTPFLLQVGLLEPHRPFPHVDTEPLPHDQVVVPDWLPDIPDVREDLADMEASIASADNAFGRIVDAIDRAGLAENTIVIFTVDHGTPFPHAKMTLKDAGLETALIMRVPGVSGPGIYDEMISNVDMTPTLLDLLGIPGREDMHGRSFRPLMNGGDYRPNEAIFAEKTYHTYYDPMRAIRTERWKLIASFTHTPVIQMSADFENNAKSYPEIAMALPAADRGSRQPLELYDLHADPHEQQNLADSPEHQATRDELARRLRQWMADTGDPLLNGPVADGSYHRRMTAFKAL
jgi:arylsulfatase A-like enzyme